MTKRDFVLHEMPLRVAYAGLHCWLAAQGVECVWLKDRMRRALEAEAEIEDAIRKVKRGGKSDG